MKDHLVHIIIPVYKSDLNDNEKLALSQCLRILGTYPISLIKPMNLNVDNLLEQYPQLGIVNFPDHFFDGIQSYNALMLSPSFYNEFISFEYILIYQLDAYVFRDELTYWCKKKFDYVAAPWVVKPKYNLLYYKVFLQLKALCYKLLGRKIIMGNVGNGGFSLRKVDSFYNATINKRKIIEKYLKRGEEGKAIFNEDIFWGHENPDFEYPTYSEALRFSFDHHPAICMNQAGRKLPFGCHGWSKDKNITFWNKYIRKTIQ